MKNKFFYIFLSILFSTFICLETNSAEQFNFDVTEIEILNNGKIIKWNGIYPSFALILK